MAQLTTLSLTDRAVPTPVVRVFSPKEIKDGVATVQFSTGVPIGDMRYSLSTRRTASGKYKSVVRLIIPIVQTQTINAVSTPVVVRTSIVELSAIFDETSSEQERSDAIGMMTNSLAATQTMVNDTLVKLQSVY